MKNRMAEASNETYCITRLKFRLFGVNERRHSENVLLAKKCYTSIVARPRACLPAKLHFGRRKFFNITDQPPPSSNVFFVRAVAAIIQALLDVKEDGARGAQNNKCRSHTDPRQENELIET